MTTTQSPQPDNDGHRSKRPTIRDEAGNAVFLALLYCLQGVPLGLSMGSMPFLLQASSSYTSIGLFGIAAYPYSCKLLWSPVVDSVFSRRFGRRKSWIVPLQGLSGFVMIFFSDVAESALDTCNVLVLSILFFVLVLLAATQDIAVDGWALTLLSKGNLGYASTCQTVGMNAGFFSSFTVFLALNDKDFCNHYFRSIPSDVGILRLSSYMRWWGVVYLAVTVYIALMKTEKPCGEIQRDLKTSYLRLWSVLKLPAVRRLVSVLMLCRLGSMTAEAAGTLKLLEKGVTKETISGIVLLEFPIELFSAVLAGKWVRDDALSPFLFAYQGRLVMAAVWTYVIYLFPIGVTTWTDHPLAFLIVLVVGVAVSFVATLMFTAQGAFFSRISDPEMGGAYLTLLNAISNLGSSGPRLAIFWLLDRLTKRECYMDEVWLSHLSCPSKKNLALASNLCTDAGGTCLIARDGFYLLSYSLGVIGFILGLYFAKTFAALQQLPLEAWRPRSKTNHSKQT